MIGSSLSVSVQAGISGSPNGFRKVSRVLNIMARFPSSNSDSKTLGASMALFSRLDFRRGLAISKIEAAQQVSELGREGFGQRIYSRKLTRQTI